MKALLTGLVVLGTASLSFEGNAADYIRCQSEKETKCDYAKQSCASSENTKFSFAANPKNGKFIVMTSRLGYKEWTDSDFAFTENGAFYTMAPKSPFVSYIVQIEKTGKSFQVRSVEGTEFLWVTGKCEFQ